MDQKSPPMVKGSSQPRCGMAMKCSKKLKTAITAKVGTMQASHGDSRGKNRRKSVAPPMT